MGLTAASTVVVASTRPETNAEAVASASRRPAAAGLVEVRLDGFREPVDLGAIRSAYARVRILATLRSRREGGSWEGGSAEAAAILRAALDAGFDLVDAEFERGDLRFGLDPGRSVVSVHDVSGTPADLVSRAARMAESGAAFVKLVVTARSIDDALRTLGAQRDFGRGATVFAMGEAGLPTRVLSPYLGAPLSFGSFEAARATAPGQLAADDLADVYGIGTGRIVESAYTIVGGRVSHSLSPALHNALFRARGIRALFVPVALATFDEVATLRAAFEELGIPIRATSVTIPFKEDAASFAGVPGAVNTLLFRNGATDAANTDLVALRSAVPPAPAGAAALVLGAGGYARPAAAVAVERGYRTVLSGRSRERAEALAAATGAAAVPWPPAAPAGLALVVNATPLGLDAADPLPCPPAFLRAGLVVVDGPYRPGGTALSLAARESGATVVDGFQLLLRQAAAQATLFLGGDVSKRDLLASLAPRHRAYFPEAA